MREKEDEELPPEDVSEEIEIETDRSPAIRGFVVGILVGTIAGVSAALLLAPERGKIVRRRIGRKARQAGRDASVRLDVWRRQAGRRRRTRQAEREVE